MKQLIQCISYYQTSKGLKVGHLSRLQKLKPISLSRPHWPQVRALGTLELPGDGFYAGFDFPVVHLGIPKNHIKGFWAYLDNANFRFMSQLSNRSNIRKLRTKNCTQLRFRPNPEFCTHARFATFVLRFELFWSPKMDNWEVEPRIESIARQF